MQQITKFYLRFAIAAWSLALATTNPQFTELLIKAML